MKKINTINAIDFRSDTVTQPTDEMRNAMLKAKVGDDVYGDDPTVNMLQEKVSSLLGKEESLFVTSGTQSNLCALLSHCQRGDEILTGSNYHVFLDEAGGASVLGGVMMHPLKTKKNGTIDSRDIVSSIKPDDPHCPITKLLSLENTVSGKAQTLTQLNIYSDLAKKHHLALHMDGARLMNAAVKLNTSAKTLVRQMDSVSLCLSKGLGSPIGSVLAGSKNFIKKAYRIRKLVGGGLRQSGILAAAGIYALDNHIERLSIDHSNAKNLAEILTSIPSLDLNVEEVETNMIFLRVPKGSESKLKKYLLKHNILINADNNELRLVTHLDIDAAKIAFFCEKVKSFFS